MSASASAKTALSPGPAGSGRRSLPFIDADQADLRQAIRAELRKPRFDRRTAAQDHAAGRVQASGGVGDHPDTRSVDETQIGHIDGDIPLDADRLPKRERKRFGSQEIHLSRQPDTRGYVLAADAQ